MSVFPDNAQDSEKLLKQADIAMYNAKRSTHYKVQRYDENEDWISKRFYMEQELRRALDRHEFSLHYHPLVELEGFRVVGVEALLRWHHPERGIVLPGEFLPVLEETGLIEPVGKWVLQTACSQIKSWQKRGWPLIYVSINLSSRQLHNPDFVGVIDQALSQTDLDPFYLGLELTESMAAKDSERVRKTLNTLSERRVRILLDDFGKNGSSLKSLRLFSVDTVKICQSFVRDLPDNKENAAITEAIIAMAHSLGKTVLAEGVTSRREAEFLRRKGCDYAQGFLFGKPFPAKKIGESKTQAALTN
jgi:EAL domain-containing protein (putative c-di-GMP-specific phosphodiesterase class I)